MPDPRHVRFLITVASTGIAATILGAALAPPDPATQLRWLATALVVALPVGYLLAYRGGYDRLLGE